MDIKKSLHMAFQHYQAGDLLQAERICREILEEERDNGECLYLIGIVYAGLEKYDLAVQNLKRSLQYHVRNPDAYLALGAVFQRQGRSHEALRCYEEAVEIDPGFAEAYENLGDLCRDDRHLEKAVSYYKKALQYCPDSPEILCSLGNIFREQRKNDLAAFYYRQTLRYRPDDAEACRNLGIICHEQGRLEEAMRYYEKALLSDPTVDEVRAHLEDASREMRHRDEAVRHCQSRAGFAINIGFLKIQMLVNAVINQFYFEKLNVQFHPDVRTDEDGSPGFTRRILEGILAERREIPDLARFFADLDRLSAIWRQCAGDDGEAAPLQNETDVRRCRKPCGMTRARRLHEEFMSTAAVIEAQLVKVLHS